MMGNDRNIDELQRSNAELNALIARLLADTDALFGSRTWSIGYRIANSVRWLQRIAGGADAQVHIGPDHFRKLADSYYACQSRPSAPGAVAIAAAAPVTSGAPVVHSGIPEIPKNYIDSDVEVAIRDLWSQVSRTRQNNG